MLTANFPTPEQIATDIEDQGFCVYHDAIELGVYEQLRKHWLEYFLSNPPHSSFVRGGLFLGEPSFNSYSKSHLWDLYRYFDFLWNTPAHQLSRDISIEIHQRRNIAQGFEARYGLDYNENRYGIYTSISYYPPDGGYLMMHADGHSDIPLLHFMLPLTFKGQDYSEGGLVCVGKDDVEVDVDAQMKPGSIVFFDGRQRHGVHAIESDKNPKLGRLALFAVPTIFESGTKFSQVWRDTKNTLYFTLEGLAVKARDTIFKKGSSQ